MLAERAGALALHVEVGVSGAVVTAAWAQGTVIGVLVAAMAVSGVRSVRRGSGDGPAGEAKGAMG